MRGVFTIVLALAACAGPVRAQDVAPPPEAETTSPERERALDLFEQAERAYEAGDIDRAVALLVEARSIYEEPVLLFNLARAYETLGRIDDALAAYRQFLVEQPTAPDRGAIEARIEALEAQIARRERLEREREAAEARAREARTAPSPVPWIVAGVGAAAVLGGVAFGLLALDARSTADADPIHETAVETFARGEDFALAANVLFIAGGVIALTGLVWGLIDLTTTGGDDDPTEITLGVGSIAVRSRF